METTDATLCPACGHRNRPEDLSCSMCGAIVRGRLVLYGAAVLLYPLFAFTRLREVVHLLGGHLGELVFATVFFWRGITGGFVKQTAERPLYAMLGWSWMGGCVLLFASLTVSEESRRWYLTNGSFGLQNDFVRLAAMLDVPLPLLTAPMALLSLLPLPAAWFLAKRRER